MATSKIIKKKLELLRKQIRFHNNLYYVLDEPKIFSYYNFKAEKKELQIDENQLAFTYCQVPIIYTLTDKKCSIGMVLENGKSLNVEGKEIDKKMSDAVFNRTGTIRLTHFNCQKYNLILQ